MKTKNTINLSRGCEIETEKSGEYTENTVMVISEAHVDWSSGWLASVKLEQKSTKFGTKLNYKFFNADSSKLSRAGNGLKYYNNLSCGKYACSSVLKSKVARIWFFTIEEINNEISITFYEEEEFKSLLAKEEGRDLEAEKLSEIQKEIDNLDKLAKDLSLPELIGSEKQIKWAVDLRKKAIAKKSSLDLQNSSAKYWIDNRYSI